MAQKLSANFMAELFKLIYSDISLTRIAVCNLTYQLIPKEWPGYKYLLREAIEIFTKNEVVPSLGVVSQKYIENDSVQETIAEIQNANKVDREIIIDQLESYIKDVEFQLLSKKVHDLYEENKKDEAIKVNLEESQRILSISLRHDGGNFSRVFNGFETRMKNRRCDSEENKVPDHITLGIDRLDAISYGGALIEDTVLWIMRSGQGKAQSLDSDIITPTGIIKMRDVKVGTKIVGSDGCEQEVIAIHPQGVIDCYKVTFDDGTEVECNDKHIWRVSSRRYKRWQNLELKDLLNENLRLSGFHNGEKYITKDGKERWGSRGMLKWKIPNQPIIHFKKKDILIDPYTLGALLGDGCLTKNLSFTTEDEEILNRMKFPEKISLKRRKNCKYGYSIKKGESNYSIKDYLEKYKLFGTNSSTKFIPKEYIFNDYETRLELLRGILDTDGYVSKIGVIELALVSKQLIEDVAFIARSLGCLCHKVSHLKSSYKNKKGEKIQCKDSYRLRIVPPKGLDLFHLSRKSERAMQDKKINCIDRMIESIEYVGKKEMQCITVSNQDGLYLTNNFIVTHNSTILRHHGMAAAYDGHPVLHIQLEGGVKACLDKYDQYWTGQEFNDIRSGFLKPEDQKQIMNAYKAMKNYGEDITVYGFEKFGEASMVEVRNIVLDYHKIYGFYPRVLILDSLDLVKTGINSTIDNNPNFKKDKLQSCAQLFKNLCVEFKMVGITATQTGNVPIEIWDNPEKVIDRSYTEGDRTLVKPFSFVFTGNTTREEKNNCTMRIYIDKLRDFKESQLTFPIATNYDKGRFYDKSRTIQLFSNEDERNFNHKKSKDKVEKLKRGERKVNTI